MANPGPFRYGTSTAQYSLTQYGVASISVTTSITGVVASTNLGLIGLSINVSPILTGVGSTSQAGDGSEKGTAIFPVPSTQGAASTGIPVAHAGSNSTLSGVAGTGSLGSTTEKGTAKFLLQGVVGTAHVSPTLQSASISVDISGRQATTALGTLLIGRFTSVTLTGVQALGRLGSTTEKGTANIFPLGASARSLAGEIDPTRPFYIYSVYANGQVESLTAKGSATAPIVLQPLIYAFPDRLTTHLGTLSLKGSCSFRLTGVQGSAQVGTVTQNNGGTSINLTLVGVQATGRAGALNNGYASITGVQASAQHGTVIQSNVFPALITSPGMRIVASRIYPHIDAVARPSGSQGVAHAANVVVKGTANANLSGVEALGQKGSPTESAGAVVTIHGVLCAGELGDPSIVIRTNAPITGIQLDAQYGTLSESGDENTILRAVAATGSLGTLSESGTASFLIPSVQSACQLGSVVAHAGASVLITGLSASGTVHRVVSIRHSWCVVS